MKSVISAIILTLALLMAGCSSGDIDFSGYVVGKRHDKARTHRTYDVVTHAWRTYHHPERWLVWVADSTGVRRYNVSRSVYDAVEKGQFVTPKADTGYGEDDKDNEEEADR